LYENGKEELLDVATPCFPLILRLQSLLPHNLEISQPEAWKWLLLYLYEQRKTIVGDVAKSILLKISRFRSSLPQGFRLSQPKTADDGSLF